MATPKKQPKHFDFSQRLRRKATNARCTQKDIAMVLSTSPTIVKKWFDGLSVPKGKKLNGLANMVKTTPEWLLTGDAVELNQAETTATDVPAPAASTHVEEPENLLEKSTNTSDDAQEQPQPESSHEATDDEDAGNEDDEAPVLDSPTTKDVDVDLAPVPAPANPTTAKPATKKKPNRTAKPKLTLKENIAKLEAELKVLRKQAKLEKRAEHEALGDLAFTMADKDADFAKLLLESLQASLENKPKQANAKALTKIMLAVEKKVLSDEQTTDAQA